VVPTYIRSRDYDQFIPGTADANTHDMAAVLALLTVPVLLVGGLAVSAAFSSPTATSVLTAGFFVAVLVVVFIGLLMWFHTIDNADSPLQS